MADVLCLGEILVDWVCTTQGAELDTAQVFTKAPGGAPANVAVGLARQNVSTGFIGRVAKDGWGQWLRDLLQNEGIDTSMTVMDEKANTRMAYVVTTVTGDRKLAEFSRIACADAQLSEEDLNESEFKNASVLHFGSISLIAEPCRNATTQAKELAKKHGLLVSYDPNVRLGLWPSPEACRTAILETLQWADLVKINLDELEFLTGSREFAAAEKLRQQYGLTLLIITLDAQGSHFITEQGSRTVPGFPIQLVEATGAGDGFVSGILAGLLPHIKSATNRKQALKELTMDQLGEIFNRANAVGAIACTRVGAMPALPKLTEIDAFMEKLALPASS
jgi:sugar/nucleoside kinase (ribokinase family)